MTYEEYLRNFEIKLNEERRSLLIHAIRIKYTVPMCSQYLTQILHEWEQEGVLSDVEWTALESEVDEVLGLDGGKT